MSIKRSPAIRMIKEAFVEVEVVPTTYCKPFKMDIEVETCRTRLVAIKAQFDREGRGSLSKEQRKCYECGEAIDSPPETKDNNDLKHGGKTMSKGLTVLNKSLYEQLGRLSDTSIKGDELSKEIERSKAMSEVSKQIINTGRLALDAIKTVGAPNRPSFLELEDTGPE